MRRCRQATTNNRCNGKLKKKNGTGDRFVTEKEKNRRAEEEAEKVCSASPDLLKDRSSDVKKENFSLIMLAHLPASGNKE